LGAKWGWNLKFPQLKKYLDAELSISGGAERIIASTDSVYRVIINEDQEITQRVNLLRMILCGNYKIACEDATISDVEREKEKRELMDWFERKIEEIDEKNSVDENIENRDPVTPAPIREEPVLPTPQPDWFTSTAKTDVAILGTGDTGFNDLEMI
jgi:hypothetical protein